MRLRRKRNSMYKVLLLISVFLLPVGTCAADSVSEVPDKTVQSTQSKSDQAVAATQPKDGKTATPTQSKDGKAATPTQSESDKSTESTQSNKSTFTDAQCGDGASCPKGTECYYCSSTEQNACYVANNVPPGCSPALESFTFLVKDQVIHLDAKKYNKYACRAPQVMKKLGNNLIECVAPADSAKHQTPAKSDSPQTDASR